MVESTANPGATFQLILDTAEQLIREKGCQQTTLQGIMDRTGLSKGAIYHYVSSKDELFGLILKSRMGGMNAQFQEAVAEAAPQDASLPIRFIAEGMAQRTEDRDVTGKIFVYLLSKIESPPIAAILKDVYSFGQQTAAAWIRIGQEKNALPKQIDASYMAAFFMVFTYGLRIQNMIPLEAENKVGVEDIFTLLLRTLKGS